MDMEFKTIVWRQFGAAIDMLENAIVACPADLWNDRSRHPEFWYLAFHTLFWLDFYLAESPEGYVPPPPFGLEELDPAGRLPARPYSKDELGTFLKSARTKCRLWIAALTPEKASERFKFGRTDLSLAELLLYNLRHVQHHAAQLNLILRQTVNSAPGWVHAAKADTDPV